MEYNDLRDQETENKNVLSVEMNGCSVRPEAVQEAVGRIREDKIIVVIMAGTRENFYDQLKQYIKR